MPDNAELPSRKYGKKTTKQYNIKQEVMNEYNNICKTLFKGNFFILAISKLLVIHFKHVLVFEREFFNQKKSSSLKNKLQYLQASEIYKFGHTNFNGKLVPMSVLAVLHTLSLNV